MVYYSQNVAHILSLETCENTITSWIYVNILLGDITYPNKILFVSNTSITNLCLYHVYFCVSPHKFMLGLHINNYIQIPTTN